MYDDTREADTIRIVIADHYASIRYLYNCILSDQGHEIVGEAVSSRQAIECYLKLSPDLLIIEQEMQDMSGMEAIRKIRSIDQEANILLTTFDQTYARPLAQKLGVREILVKPFNMYELIDIVKKM